MSSSSLILITCDSGAGHLKREKHGARILTFTHRLVTGPIPTGGTPAEFFVDRQAVYRREGLFHENWWFEVEDRTGENPRFKRIWSLLPQACLAHDQVTLWIDPDPNAQLVLVQLLDWLGRDPAILGRLWLKQAESPTGSRMPGDPVVPPRRVEREDVELASRVWQAFGAVTPEAWAALRHEPGLERLPALPLAVEMMLNELPDHTGLGASARHLLRHVDWRAHFAEDNPWGRAPPPAAVDDAARRPERLITRAREYGKRLPPDHFEWGRMLCELATAPMPALSGVTETEYSIVSHMDEERFRSFCNSHVTMTTFGNRLVAGEDDWVQHNPIHRWWGGTRLTNDSLWRWDRTGAQLVAPS